MSIEVAKNINHKGTTNVIRSLPYKRASNLENKRYTQKTHTKTLLENDSNLAIGGTCPRQSFGRVSRYKFLNNFNYIYVHNFYN